ncbi:MAG: Lrp/AsnC family transcriptional regulator [Thiofilum sp.]|uniref:Lrp/AsnC family transcriptional regulator n=1 Tax=Thiofilum sp. TaxID=2212733 RepID=UPI0025E74233|nr:Lrp/AsnC family transcriptional regulator [Thiofilum sp.]MBK8452983.1 Lrp/AsnC family transcriptional regulator [Thiofilum sp.]
MTNKVIFIDRKDQQLLNLLQRQGRMTIAELAEQVHLSDTPCLRRIKKLEQSGVIKGYSALLDPKSIGLQVQALAFVELVDNTCNSAEIFEQAVTELEEVIECAVVTGGYDYMLKIVAKDLEDYGLFIKNKIGAIKVVAKTESTLAIKQVFSRTYLPVYESEF